jgi:hypothetical protein
VLRWLPGPNYVEDRDMSYTQRTVVVHLHNETKVDLQLVGFHTDFHTFFRVPPPELLKTKDSCVFGTDCIHLEAEGWLFRYNNSPWQGIARAVFSTGSEAQLQLDWRMGKEGFDVAASSSLWRVDKSSLLEHRGCRSHVYFIVSEMASTGEYRAFPS